MAYSVPNARQITARIFGSEMEATPEGFYWMESIRRAADEQLAALDPLDRMVEIDLRREIDRAIFFGTL